MGYGSEPMIRHTTPRMDVPNDLTTFVTLAPEIRRESASVVSADDHRDGTTS